MLVLEFPLGLRTPAIKVCQRVLWVKSLGSWVSHISCTLLQTCNSSDRHNSQGAVTGVRPGYLETKWGIFCVYCDCWCLSAQWYCEKAAISKRSHSNGSGYKEGREGREESWPTVFCSVISKLYGTGLVSVSLGWTSFKWCKCLYWATHNRAGT